MSGERAEPSAGVTHVQQSMPRDWDTFKWGETTFVVYEVPEGPGVELYIPVAVTRNIRNLARADAVLYEGNLVRPHFDDTICNVEFCHDYAGTVGRHAASEWLDEPVVRLSKLPHADPQELIGL